MENKCNLIDLTKFVKKTGYVTYEIPLKLLKIKKLITIDVSFNETIVDGIEVSSNRNIQHEFIKYDNSYEKQTFRIDPANFCEGNPPYHVYNMGNYSIAHNLILYIEIPVLNDKSRLILTAE